MIFEERIRRTDPQILAAVKRQLLDAYEKTIAERGQEAHHPRLEKALGLLDTEPGWMRNLHLAYRTMVLDRIQRLEEAKAEAKGFTEQNYEDAFNEAIGGDTPTHRTTEQLERLGGKFWERNNMRFCDTPLDTWKEISPGTDMWESTSCQESKLKAP